MTQVVSHIATITAGVKDAANKPYLRSVMEAELLKLGHSADEVEHELDVFFGLKGKTLQ